MIRSLSMCLVLVACAGPLTVDGELDATIPAGDPAPPNPGRSATVVHVADGDSLVVSIDGSDERVRLIGINTPERDECYGREASEALEDLVGDQVVAVVPDVDETDQYGRLLAYLYIDGLLVNAELVRRGAALARPYEPNTTLQDHLEAAEDAAQAAGVGMWSPTCTSDQAEDIVIATVNADAPGRDDENLNGEWITIANRSATSVDMDGWTVRDESSVHRYTFGTFELAPGAEVTVRTGCGDDTADILYWCEPTPVWDNRGDTAFLIDATGATIATFEY